MKSRLADEKVPNEQTNHLARRQTPPPRLALQRHGLASRNEHRHLDHFFIQTTDLLSLGSQMSWLLGSHERHSCHTGTRSKSERAPPSAGNRTIKNQTPEFDPAVERNCGFFHCLPTAGEPAVSMAEQLTCRRLGQSIADAT